VAREKAKKVAAFSIKSGATFCSCGPVAAKPTQSERAEFFAGFDKFFNLGLLSLNEVGDLHMRQRLDRLHWMLERHLR
jgi:hypothetical protein